MSMKDVGILDGDLVAVHRTPDVRSRQIVVARLENEVTVKRYRQEGSVVWLMPENDAFEPIRVDLKEEPLLIEGIVVGGAASGPGGRPHVAAASLRRPRRAFTCARQPCPRMFWPGCSNTRVSGAGRSFNRIDTLSSGFPELDARLAGGWPKVGLVEILATHLGSGELRLLLPLLVAVTQQSQARWCTWIAPPLNPYAPALAARGVNLSRVLVVHVPKGPEWACEQALISGACDVVLAWITQPLKPCIVRRLQLAAQRGRTLAFLLRPCSSRLAQQPSHALLRLGVEPESHGHRSGVRLSILKSRGGATGEWWLDLNAAQAAAGV